MKTIHYYRVSTVKQGQSGLGLEAQRASVEAFCKTRGCEPLAEYIEVESGRKSNRPELIKALHHAKVTGATLVIAKLNRLSRNAAFLMNLQEAKVKFICVDMPDANELTVGIMALVAQQEAIDTSIRTKEALQAAKARGTKLGNPNGAKAFGDSRDKAASALRSSLKRKADNRAKDIMPIITAIQADGMNTYRAIADALNERGIMTARGGQWYATTVKNMVERLTGTLSETI
jgi:DNA invertase Pin-like site-specific DNA recombinase